MNCIMYKITKYSFQRAKEHGLTLKPSENKKKKIDVFKNGIKISSIGSINYKDYPNYIIEKGIDYANVRRKLYRIRHAKDIKIKDSNGYFANLILW